jgi:DNA-binding transcriptional ArsR family regulator
MGKLKAAGLVDCTKRGIWVYYRLRDDMEPATLAVLKTLLGPIAPEQRKGSLTYRI